MTEYASRWDLLMAAWTVVALPMVAVFLLFQHSFIEEITLTGL